MKEIAQEIMGGIVPMLLRVAAAVISVTLTFYIPVIFRRINERLGIENSELEELRFEEIVKSAMYTQEQRGTQAKNNGANLPAEAKKIGAEIRIVEELASVGIKKTSKQIDDKIEAMVAKYGNKLIKWANKI